MTRIQLVLIWVIGRLCEMEAAGIIEGKRFRLSGNGIQDFEILKEQSFIPARDEIVAALKCVGVPQDLHDDFIHLMVPSY